MDQTGTEIRVVIVEDQRIAREGLAQLIQGTPGYRVVGAHTALEEALRTIEREAPDVVLLDINLPGKSGSEGVADVLGLCPEAAVLMLSVFEDQDKIFESICNGACGYLLKKTPPARLLEAIREVHEGGSPMSPEIARKVIRYFRGVPAPAQSLPELPDQQRRLLALLAEGYSYQACSERLGIKVNTVRNYVRLVYEKLHVHSKAGAVAKALKHRLI
ncbi:MAG TPA: response regulator transcription factor [Thermoanaerobaculia bacterium]|nr:response regulator transcription factor [Thermoanaerobaculia bacterium]